MNRIFLIILFCSFITISAVGITSFVFEGDVNYAPIAYEPQLSLYSTSLNTALLLGLRMNNIRLGTSVYANYFSFDGQNESDTFIGARLLAGGRLDLRIAFNGFFSLNAGAGGYWVKSMQNSNNTGWLSLDQPGVSAELGAGFELVEKIFSLSISNTINFNINTHSTISIQTLPQFTGGIKLSFCPGIKWLTLYSEVKGMYWNYQTPVRNLETWMAEVTVGTTIDFTGITGYGKKTVNKTTPLPEIPAKLAVAAGNPGSEDNTDPELLSLINSRVGDKVVFTSIKFEENSTALTKPDSPSMNSLAEYLSEHPQMELEIAAYTESAGNPVLEFQLIRDRGAAVKNYLVSKGITEERLEISNQGYFITRKDKDNNIFSRVIFTIVKDSIENSPVVMN